MSEIEKISAEHYVNNENFADFIIFRLYSIFSKNSIPKWLLNSFEKIENENMENITSFFTEYINSINDLNLLNAIWDELNWKIWKWVSMWSNWNIAKAIKSLLVLLSEKIRKLEKEIDAENIKEEIKSQTQEILEQKEIPKPKRISKYIKLENWTFDFDIWNDVFNRYLICFWKIINYPWIRFHKLKEFIEPLKKENRWFYNVFPKINLFLEHFQIIKFYKYILNVLSSDDPKKLVLAQAIKKYFPILKISWLENNDFLELQRKILLKAKKELEKQKSKRKAK